jgi:hypothetical protein
MNIQVLRMNKIVTFIKRIRRPEYPILLGRWEITYCKRTMNKKIDLANEDHCGICYSTKYHNPTYVSPYMVYTKNAIIDLE